VRLVIVAACCLSAAACFASTEAPSGLLPATSDPPAATEPSPTARDGSASVDGTVDGAPVVLTSAVAIPGSLSERAPERRGVRIVLRNQPGMCTSPAIIHPGATALTLDVEARPQRALEVGTYEVADVLSNAKGVHARFDRARVTCASSTILARSGTVTITKNDGATLRGTFELMIAHEHVTGRFEARLCDALPSGFVDLDERCER
jgi:hypothetical protein